MAVPNPTAARPPAKKGVSKSAVPAILAMFPTLFIIFTLNSSASNSAFAAFNALMESLSAFMYSFFA